MAIVLGVDAGFAACGLVAVDIERGEVIAWDVCHTKRTATKRGVRVADDDAERCQEITRAIIPFATMHECQGAVIELPSGGAQGARANRSMGMATGVVVATLHCLDIAAEYVTPGDVKKASAGSIKASKEAVQEAMERAWSWNSKPTLKKDMEHVYDAAGAVWAARDGVLVRTLRRSA